MFCDGCGTAVQPGQTFCSRCGKQIVGPVTGDAAPVRASSGARPFARNYLACDFRVQHYRRSGGLHPRQHIVCSPARTRRARGTNCVFASLAECDWRLRAGKGSLRIHCRMGIVAARTLGSDPHPRPWLHLAIPHTLWHGCRCVYALGSAACAVARGVRRHGCRAHGRIVPRSFHSLVLSGIVLGPSALLSNAVTGVTVLPRLGL